MIKRCTSAMMDSPASADGTLRWPAGRSCACARGVGQVLTGLGSQKQIRRPDLVPTPLLTWRRSPDPARVGRGHRGRPRRVSIHSLPLRLAAGAVEGTADAALEAAEDLRGRRLARRVDILSARRLQLPTLGACKAKRLLGHLRLQTDQNGQARALLPASPLQEKEKCF